MIKYTVKLILWKNDPNPQGLYPIYLRVTIKRDRKYIATGLFVQEKMWDERNEQVKEGHPMHAVYNPDLISRKQKAIKYIVDQQVKGEQITAGEVKELFIGKRDLHNIFDFIDQFIEECRGKKEDSTLENYRKHAARLKLFHGSRDLAFEDITVEYLARYEKHLRAPTTPGVKPVEGNYIHALWTTLKTFFNAAEKKGVITCYPFDQYENPVYDGPVKEYLTLAELKKWEEYADKAKDPTKKQAAIWFLLGCYTGLRISDWQRFDFEKHVGNSRILIRAKKNKEWVSMPISQPLARNLKRMQPCPLTIVEQEINRSVKDIAKALGIPKRLTSHAGRHTFAITICADRGISAETCATLMGITIATCVNSYYRVTNRKIDQEAKKAWKGL